MIGSNTRIKSSVEQKTQLNKTEVSKDLTLVSLDVKTYNNFTNTLTRKVILVFCFILFFYRDRL
jgi:hypothetical protein